MKNKSRLMIIAIILILIMAIMYFDVISWFSVDNINGLLNEWKDQVKSQRLLVSIVGIGVYMAVVSLALPVASLITLSMGILLGFTNGVIVVVIGATLGAAVNFLLTRYLIGDAIQKKYGDKLKKINQELEENGKSYLLTLRLIPIFPFFLINLAAGLSNVRFSTFIVTTMLGIIPGTSAYVYLGSSLSSLTEGSPGVPTNVIVAFVALGVLALVPVIYKKIKKK